MYILIILRVFWLLASFLITFVGWFVKFFSELSEKLNITQLSKWGKLLKSSADQAGLSTTKTMHEELSLKKTNFQFLNFLEWCFCLKVSKSNFFHFYVVGFTGSFSTLLYCLQMDFESSCTVYKEYPKTGVTQLSCLLSLLLLSIQTFRRALECKCIHIFSESGKIHISHYIVGIAFYVLITLSAVVESPFYTFQGHCINNNDSNINNINNDNNNNNNNNNVDFNITKTQYGYFSFTQLCGCLLFFYSAYHQHISHVILRNLRMNNSPNVIHNTSTHDEKKKVSSHGHAEVTSKEYKVPMGDWFEYITSPHYLMEILIYLSLLLINAFQNVTLNCAFVFVTVNLSWAALETHNWYLVEFDEYKRYGRTALIPFLV